MPTQGYVRGVIACRVFGHRHRFSATGTTMSWACARCGAEGGSKTYESAAEAERYARAFDRDESKAGSAHPTLSTLPLAVMRRLFGRRRSG